MARNIILRNAVASDGADLAILDNIASNGLSLWFWQGAVNMGKSENALDWGRTRMRDDSAPFAFSNAVISECDGVVAGCATGYIYNKARQGEDKTSSPVLAPLYELMRQCNDHWYLDCLAVYEEFRNIGVGTRLIQNCIDRARACNSMSVSLITEDINKAALSVYQAAGFEIKDQAPCIKYKKEIKTKDWLLLSLPV